MTKKITTSGMVIALYVVIMYLTQSFSFGQYQIRIATSLYSLSYIHPFLIIPMGIANLISNTVMGGLGILDMLGGTVVGIITSSLIYLIKKFNLNIWLITVPIIFIPSLLVPIWLSYLINIPYLILVPSVAIGQIIPAVLGVFIIKRIKFNFKFK